MRKILVRHPVMEPVWKIRTLRGGVAAVWHAMLSIYTTVLSNTHLSNGHDSVLLSMKVYSYLHSREECTVTVLHSTAVGSHRSRNTRASAIITACSVQYYV